MCALCASKYMMCVSCMPSHPHVRYEQSYRECYHDDDMMAMTVFRSDQSDQSDQSDPVPIPFRSVCAAPASGQILHHDRSLVPMIRYTMPRHKYAMIILALRSLSMLLLPALMIIQAASCIRTCIIHCTTYAMSSSRRTAIAVDDVASRQQHVEIADADHHHTYVERDNLYNNISILHICV